MHKCGPHTLDHTRKRVPQGGAEGPFLYLLVTLPLAYALLQQDYPSYAPFPFQSPPINFADDNTITIAKYRPKPGDQPTATQPVEAILTDTVQYLETHNLLIQPQKSVAMVLGDIDAPAPHPGAPPLPSEPQAVVLGVVQTAHPNQVCLPPGLTRKLTGLPKYAQAGPLSTHGLAYYLAEVLNASVGFQGFHLSHPREALAEVTRVVAKAWTPQPVAHLYTPPSNASCRPRGRGGGNGDRCLCET